MLQFLGPLVPVGAVVFGQRAPRGEVIETAALPIQERLISDLAAGREFDQVDAFQRRAFNLPRAVAVDLLAAIRAHLQLRLRPADAASVPDIGELRNCLDPHVYGIEESA